MALTPEEIERYKRHLVLRGFVAFLDPPDPSSIGTYRWAGGVWTFFWVDPKADLIGMIWAQVAPVSPEMGPFEKRFEGLVYDAITGR